MLRMKDTKKLIRNVLRALPDIPYIAPKKTSSVLPFVLGAIGVAVFGGVAAVMVFSPRTRYRALDVAKEGYGKVRGQLGQLPFADKLGIQGERNTTPGGYSNGKVDEGVSSSYQTSGL